MGRAQAPSRNLLTKANHTIIEPAPFLGCSILLPAFHHSHLLRCSQGNSRAACNLEHRKTVAAPKIVQSEIQTGSFKPSREPYWCDLEHEVRRRRWMRLAHSRIRSIQKGEKVHAIHDRRHTAAAVGARILDACWGERHPRVACHSPRGVSHQPDYGSPGSLSCIAFDSAGPLEV